MCTGEGDVGGGGRSQEKQNHDVFLNYICWVEEGQQEKDVIAEYAS